MKPVTILAGVPSALALIAAPAMAPAAPVPADIPVALLVDLSSGQTLFSREPDRRFVPASVTKVMTAYTAFKLIDEGKLSPDRLVDISRELADEWSGEGSTMFLEAGDRLTVGELLLGVTTVSANDASVAIAIEAAGSLEKWLELMNANAAELGMRDTHFGTPNGWPDEGRTYTSARDLVRLTEAMTARYPGLYRRYIGHRGLSYGGIAQDNHDPITGVVDGADGIKTGYTRQAGYNFLGSAQRNGRRLAMVVAGAGSAGLRNRTARELIRWGFDNFDSRQIVPAQMQVGSVAVQDGSAGSVPVQTQSPVFANLPRGSDANVRLVLRYRGPVEAPVEAGSQVATLRVLIEGQEPHDVPLVAAEPVEKASSFQRLRNGLVGLVT